MRRRRLNSDELLFAEGEACELGMWIVSKGCIGIFQPNAECALPASAPITPASSAASASSASAFAPLLSSGSPMCLIAPGESIAEWTLITQASSPTVSFPVRAAAMGATETFFLPRAAFVSFTRRHPRSLLEFVRTAIARQWRVASYVLEAVLELPSRSREEVQGDEDAAKVDWTEMEGGGAAAASAPQHPAAAAAAAVATPGTPAPASHGSPSLSLSLTGSLPSPGHPPSPPSPLPPFTRGRGIRLVTLAPYEVLFSAGDEASSLYVVASGSLEAVTVAPSASSSSPTSATVTGTIGTGCVCGGISFMGSTSRGETVRAAAAAVTLYEYTTACIDQLMADDPAALVPIARAVGRQLAPICRQFFELGLDSRWYRAGSIVYEQGDASDAVYLVISGRVHAVMGSGAQAADGGGRANGAGEMGAVLFGEIAGDDDSEGDRQQAADTYETQYLFEVGRGEMLGEETSLGDSADEVRRPYTAVCVRDTECVRISQSTFLHLFNLNPRSMLRFARSLSHRVHMLASRSFTSSAASLQPRTPPTIATVALVWIGSSPWGGPRSFLLSFGEHLMAALREHGDCVWVDSERLRHEVGASVADQLGDVMHRSRASRWLSELEENNRFIVLETTQIRSRNAQQPRSREEQRRREEGGEAARWAAQRLPPSLLPLQLTIPSRPGLGCVWSRPTACCCSAAPTVRMRVSLSMSEICYGRRAPPLPRCPLLPTSPQRTTTAWTSV